MLINTTKNTKSSKMVVLAIVFFLVLALLKLTAESKPELFGIKADSTKKEASIEAAVVLSSKLYTEDLLTSGKNKIYTKDNFSLYLNNELGAPTLMAVYKDSISDLQRNGRFLTFLYLKDPAQWRAVNQRYDHIVLRHEKLVPIKKELVENTFYIFKFRLEHPYFKFDNLKKLEFVRHDPQIGRFTELFFEKDSLPEAYTISNTQLESY